MVSVLVFGIPISEHLGSKGSGAILKLKCSILPYYHCSHYHCTAPSQALGGMNSEPGEPEVQQECMMSSLSAQRCCHNWAMMPCTKKMVFVPRGWWWTSYRKLCPNLYMMHSTIALAVRFLNTFPKIQYSGFPQKKTTQPHLPFPSGRKVHVKLSQMCCIVGLVVTRIHNCFATLTGTCMPYKINLV